MRAQLLIVAAAAVLAAGACERRQPEEAALPETRTADEQTQRQEEATRLEQRVKELEREWNDVQQRLSGAAAGARQDVEENLTELRESVAELKTTRRRLGELREETNRLRGASEDDWWEITRDRVNEYVERVEAAIDRLATGTTSQPQTGRS